MDKDQIEKVKKGLECCTRSHQTIRQNMCDECPYKNKGVMNAFTVWKTCINALAEDALKLINELQATAEPKWIPVSENPMAWFNKLVSFKYKGETYFGEGYWSGAKWVVTGFPNNKFPNGIEVTHWMQPPELPKEGD